MLHYISDDISDEIDYHCSDIRLMRFSNAGISNPTPGELPSCRCQLQPQSSTPDPAKQGIQSWLTITGRCVGAGLELKSPGW